MIGFAPAKINLGLFVTDKRPDGFHDLESVFCPIPWNDVLEVHLREEPGLLLKLSGIPIPGKPEENLLVKAYEMVHQTHEIGGVEAHLLKAIPMGAGLGGGSSDAVCMIKLLNELFELQLSEEDGMKMAERLGSDCPFFWNAQPAYVRGRGEHIQELPNNPLSGSTILIIHPNIHIATKLAFKNIVPQAPPTDWLEFTSAPINRWGQWLRNDFQSGMTHAHESLAQCVQHLEQYGASYVQMTGTGSACFGLFENESLAQMAQTQIQNDNWISFIRQM